MKRFQIAGCRLQMAVAAVVAAWVWGGVLGADSRAEGGAATQWTPQWPDVTKEMKPWAYNWWMGSAIDEAGIDAQVEAMSKAGMGGFHAIPIYGAKGYEAKYRTFLSPEWVDAFSMAAKKARAAGLGIDLTTGTGWCFGGPQLTPQEGCRMLVVVKIPQDSQNPKESTESERSDSANSGTDSVNPVKFLAKFKPAMEAKVLWQGKDEAGDDVALVERLSLQQVKRSGPGGEGPMMDPFSVDAVRDLLKPYTKAFEGIEDAAKPGYMYHDSYEYYNAGWTPRMFQAFRGKRGYDLKDHLSELAGVGDPETIAKVKCDYRETLSDLIVEDVFPQWVEWCHDRGILTRNEAHGAPANLLDFYALADVPETEMFGCGKAKEDDPLVSRLDSRISHGDRDILISKFASSAANVKAAIEGSGAPVYTSSESCTWMAEHFNETLEGTKGFLDRLFLSGVNRIYYHGTCYSPVEAPWPGWCFYASLEMNPRNPIWRDAGALNAYIARVQSITQTAVPDNDVLVYWPIYDFWTNPEGFEKQLAVHALDWFHGQEIGRISKKLFDDGYAFDFVSDRQLGDLARAAIAGEKTHYTTVLVPAAKYMPKDTCQALAILQVKGYEIVFADSVPLFTPGLNGEPVNCTATPATGDWLSGAPVRREPFNKDAGLMFTRYRMPDGRTAYFIANQLKPVAEGDFPVRGNSVWLMNPETGAIDPLPVTDGKVHLRLAFGHSVILVVGQNEQAQAATECNRMQSNAIECKLQQPWRLTPVCGGPEGSFKPRTMEALSSWSINEDGTECPFSGTVAYETAFAWDGPCTGKAKITLGKVRESARVFVNGTEIGVAYLEPKELVFDAALLHEGANDLRIEVTSTGANRLRDLDRRGVEWKIFNDINMVDYYYKRLDASKWPLAECGLFGPVKITTL